MGIDYKKEYEQLLKEFEEFTYIVSHDFKAPLRAISNIMTWVEEDYKSLSEEELKVQFDLMKNRIQRMNNMLVFLTDYSRVYRKDIDIVETNIDELLIEIKEDFEQQYKHVKINISNQCKTVKTYQKKLSTTIHEIVTNAVKHNNDLDHIIINIKAKANNNFIELEISDNGKGIPSQVLDNVLNIFYTVENKENAKGIGGGLAYIKKIINFANGLLTIENNSDAGIVVKINWPFF